MGEDVRIEPMVESDIEPCAALMAGSEPWPRYGIGLEEARGVWQQAIDARATVEVARLGPATCGFAWYIERGAFGLSGYLKLLGVIREARGRGIGGALLGRVERRALADGQGDLFLLVSDFNLPAQQFYAAHGYRQVGALADYVCPGIGELIFRKRLISDRSTYDRM
jgi:ribosomal protein S18 acetylase RimI-like enzyme